MSIQSFPKSQGSVFQQFKEMVKYWAAAARPYKYYFLGIYFFYAIGIVAEHILTPIYYQKIVDGMVVASSEIADELLASRYQNLIQLIIIVGILSLTRVLMYRAGDWFFDYFRMGTVRNLENGMFGDYLKHGRRFFVNNFAGALLNDHRQMRGAFDVFMDHGTFTFFWWLIVFTGSLVALAFIFPIGAIGILLWFILYLIVVVLVSKRKLKHERKVAALNSSMTGLLADNLSNAMTIKTFGAEKREEGHFQKRNEVRYHARMRNKYWSRWRNGLQGGMLVILDVFVLVAGAYHWMTGRISPGTIVLILYYARNISNEVWNFSRMINSMTQAYADANKFMEHIRAQPDIVDPESTSRRKLRRGHVHFRDLSFTYPGGTKVFKDFDLEIKAGEKVGIVGPSGSGKSTLVTLLQRHMDVQHGGVLIDGVDIRQLPQAYVRSKISLVPQDPSLFHRSLRENIAYGKPDATMDEIIAAAQKAQAHEFILETPKGYDTMVGERGVKLSGGQRQRIAIARAVLEAETAPIVVFDEATSSLDNKAEKEIQEAIDAALAASTRTAVIIAHRLSTLRNVDRIIVMDQGRIVETGNHTQLMLQDGLYAELYNSQMLEVG
ncbi:MAG: ABC transporter ATP-binding protein [Saprospiraceae bacterium]|nr:ABC transporter ATP-binding protein [Saprospiraceae bacterium]